MLFRVAPVLPSIQKLPTRRKKCAKINKRFGFGAGVDDERLMLAARKPSDEAITTDIKAKMFSEPALKAATVDVVSNHGEVTLTAKCRTTRPGWRLQDCVGNQGREPGE